MELFDKIQESVAFIRSISSFEPATGLILGTGLGGLVDEIEVDTEVPYHTIPHFARSTVQSHKGALILGTLGGRKVAAMAGRFHYYEGWTMEQVTFPVRVLKYLGVEQLLVTNVSGGVNPHYKAGDIVVVYDHINLLPEHPLRGENDERIGPRFPDMVDTYSPELRSKALKAAEKLGIPVREGVYSAIQGPNLETPAEYGMLRAMGADCTGMSSVPEVLVAKHMDLPVAMLSMVSNVCWPREAIIKTSVEDVIAVANESEPKLRALIKEMLF